MYRSILLIVLFSTTLPIWASPAEHPKLQLTAADLSLLLGAKPEKPFSLTGFTDELKFKRIAIYAPKAQIKVLTETDSQKLNISQRWFFISSNTTKKVALSLDPKTNAIHIDIHQNNKKFHARGTLTATTDGNFAPLTIHQASEKMEFDCLNDLYTQPSIDPVSLSTLNLGSTTPQHHPTQFTPDGADPAFQATVAVDTDNEFLWYKFTNNTTDASQWIEDLFLNMNLIYESELNIRIQISALFLRVDTTPANNPDFNADPAGFNIGLHEFGDYWRDNYNHINRVTAMMISGRSINNFSFSGLAWVDAYCNETYSYSFNKVGSGLPAAFTAGGTAHELGHNFGTSHTHCEQLANGGTSYVDHCYSNENGCYVGTTSCPGGTNGTGTLMSYCHAPESGFDGGDPASGPPASANCDNSNDIHPLIAGKLATRLSANYPACITDFNPNFDLIFAHGFE